MTPEDGAWTVRSEVPPAVTSRHEDKQDALCLATRLALEERPSQVVVHSVGGDVTQCVIYEVETTSPSEPSGPEDELPDPSLWEPEGSRHRLEI